MSHPEVQTSTIFSKSNYKQFGVTCRDVPASPNKGNDKIWSTANGRMMSSEMLVSQTNIFCLFK